LDFVRSKRWSWFRHHHKFNAPSGSFYLPRLAPLFRRSADAQKDATPMPSSTWAGALLSGLGNRDASAIHRRDKPATWRRSFMHFSPFRATRSCVWRRLAAGGCVSVACSTPTHSRSSGLAGERLEAERGGGCGSREILGGAALQSADSSSMPSPTLAGTSRFMGIQLNTHYFCQIFSYTCHMQFCSASTQYL
jgi:hypothetical protein